MAIFKANTKYQGKASLPPSKSHLIRLLFCALLRPGKVFIEYEGKLPKDVTYVIEAVRKIGPKVSLEDGLISIDSNVLLNKAAEINLGECGTGYAFFSVLNCFPKWNLKISCEGTLKARDYSFAKVDFDYLGNIVVNGEKSSQAVSAAIICAELADEKKRDIIVCGKPCSGGYIEMTKKVLGQFQGKDELKVKAEQDGSAAAVLTAADYLGASIKINGRENTSMQPDKPVEKYFDKNEIDISENPDLIFTLAVIAASKKGKTIINNTGRLKNKESDRAKGCAELINALGGDAKFFENRIEINGKGTLTGGCIAANNDHRVVFGAFLASLISTEDIVVYDAEEAVKKSWPDFFETIKALEVKNA